MPLCMHMPQNLCGSHKVTTILQHIWLICRIISLLSAARTLHTKRGGRRAGALTLPPRLDVCFPVFVLMLRIKSRCRHCKGKHLPPPSSNFSPAHVTKRRLLMTKHPLSGLIAPSPQRRDAPPVPHPHGPIPNGESAGADAPMALTFTHKWEDVEFPRGIGRYSQFCQFLF